MTERELSAKIRELLREQLSLEQKLLDLYFDRRGMKLAADPRQIWCVSCGETPIVAEVGTCESCRDVQ